VSGSVARVLADTNVWIAFFRGSRASEQDQRVADVLDRLIVEDRVVTCGIVEMELSQGLREGEHATFEENVATVPFLDATRQDFQEFRRSSGAHGPVQLCTDFPDQADVAEQAERSTV
jgi:predicted nucleic acid-binding protein